MTKIGMSLFAGFVMLGATACDDGVVDKAENAAKCRVICSQLDECNSDVDISECRSDCSDIAENDDIETRVEDCSECLDVTDSCDENVQMCATRCAGVVVLTATNPK
ncbi:MAG: hypothetical protein ABW252_25680 [Polyangiales bacterium]